MFTALGGCASDGQIERASRLLPDQEKRSFAYTSYAAEYAPWAASINKEWRKDDPVAEEKRLHWLENKLKMNAMCPSGYKIIDRQVVVTGKGSGGENAEIHYKGVCN